MKKLKKVKHFDEMTSSRLIIGTGTNPVSEGIERFFKGNDL